MPTRFKQKLCQISSSHILGKVICQHPFLTFPFFPSWQTVANKGLEKKEWAAKQSAFARILRNDIRKKILTCYHWLCTCWSVKDSHHLVSNVLQKSASTTENYNKAVQLTCKEKRVSLLFYAQNRDNRVSTVVI